jgi:molybdopterin-guanine dinucleotide biosynthesis protein A
MRIDGVVLAGGRSRRFGSDKRVALLDGAELVQIAIRKLASVCDGTLYVATGAKRQRLPGTGRAVLLADEPPGRGPLGGIAAGLRRARDGVLVLACDVPIVRTTTLDRIVRSARTSGARPVALRGLKGWEPLVAWYPRSALHAVETELRSAKPAPWTVLERLAAVPLPVLDAGEMLNVNTPEDLSNAVRARRPRRREDV